MNYSICSSAQSYLDTLSATIMKVDRIILDVYGDLLFKAWTEDKSVYVFGNGGSASCASHHVADYVKTAEVNGQKRLKAFSLTDNVPLMTAIGNDLSYEEIFSYPLKTYAREHDIAVAISCSGNSPNVVMASELAKDMGLTLVAITGFSGGKIGKIADIHINFPSDNYGIIEDLQMSVSHIAAQRLKSRIEQEVVS
jgi:D-sedoheptulose 7-phosphate isomerase